MKNTEFKVGDHIAIHGNKGIVEAIERYDCYNASYNGKAIDNVSRPYSDEQVKDMLEKGYVLEATGETYTYFTVSFKGTDLEDTPYDGGSYGSKDQYEVYGTWK